MKLLIEIALAPFIGVVLVVLTIITALIGLPLELLLREPPNNSTLKDFSNDATNYEIIIY